MLLFRKQDQKKKGKNQRCIRVTFKHKMLWLPCMMHRHFVYSIQSIFSFEMTLTTLFINFQKWNTKFGYPTYSNCQLNHFFGFLTYLWSKVNLINLTHKLIYNPIFAQIQHQHKIQDLIIQRNSITTP